jgi:signal transduction histidine kinase
VGQLADWAARFASERELPLRLELPTETLGETRLDPWIAEAAHAAVRVALANVVEHARATQAVLRLQRRGDHLVVEVEDDGVGIGSVADVFTSNRPGAHGSRGLVALRSRVERLEGDLALEESLPAGTRLRVRLPVLAWVRLRGRSLRGGFVGWPGPQQPSSSGSL